MTHKNGNTIFSNVSSCRIWAQSRGSTLTNSQKTTNSLHDKCCSGLRIWKVKNSPSVQKGTFLENIIDMGLYTRGWWNSIGALRWGRWTMLRILWWHMDRPCHATSACGSHRPVVNFYDRNKHWYACLATSPRRGIEFQLRAAVLCVSSSSISSN